MKGKGRGWALEGVGVGGIGVHKEGMRGWY